MPPRPWSRNSGSSWLSQSSCFGHLSIPSSTFVSFASPSETPTGVCRPSWLVFPSGPAEASLGVVQRSPFRRISSVSPLPACLLPKEPAAFGRVPPGTQHLPPLSFLPTSTVYSSQNPAGLLHPASSHGVRAVSFRASLRSLCSSRWSSQPSPTRHSHPPEPFPRTQPHCVTAAVASSPSSWCLPPSSHSPK